PIEAVRGPGYRVALPRNTEAGSAPAARAGPAAVAGRDTAAARSAIVGDGAPPPPVPQSRSEPMSKGKPSRELPWRPRSLQARQPTAPSPGLGASPAPAGSGRRPLVHA